MRYSKAITRRHFVWASAAGAGTLLLGGSLRRSGSALASAQTSAPPTVDRLAVRVVVDSYQDALVELVKSKIAGQAPVIIQEDELPATFSFAEALKQSLEGVGRPAEKSAAKPAATKKPPGKSEPAAGRKQKRKQA